MKICLINPNTTQSMTEKAARSASAVLAETTGLIATQPKDGPVSIEGYYDEAFSVPGLLQEIKNHSADGYILACFDDTGLDAARCATEKPVVAIGEAAFHIATLLAPKFGVVTTLSRSVNAIEHNLVRYGLDSRCSGVRASEIPVLELETIDPDHIDSNPHYQSLARECERSLVEDGAEAIVLGCAGMSNLNQLLSEQFSVPVIDGVAAAAKMVESLVTLGYQTSKLRTYAAPGTKPYHGTMKPFEPS